MSTDSEEDYEHCGARHSEGWFCLLRKGHEGPHVSFDNRVIWNRTPGVPVTWNTDKAFSFTITSEDPRRSSENAAEIPGQRPGFTGSLCLACGSENTVKIGMRVRCTECGHEGESE